MATKGVFHENQIKNPVKWKKPRMIFVSSMGDLFHPDVKEDYLDEIMGIIASDAPQHTYLFLTKRPDIMKKRLSKYHLWPNLWVGATAENQQRFMERVPTLLQIPAAVRFASIEPMLSKICANGFLNKELNGCEIHCPGTKGMCRLHAGECNEAYESCAGLDWIICGGETGPGARLIAKEWVISLRDQCVSAGVSFFFKKWGSVMFGKSGNPKNHMIDGEIWEQMP